MTKPLQSSQFHLVFHWYFSYFCQNILISSLLPPVHSNNVLQTPHLEGMYSFEALLSDCPCLCYIEKYRDYHHSKHMNLGLLTHTSTSEHLPPPHLVHCGSLLQSCAHLSIYPSSLPHFTPQIGECFYSLQCVAPISVIVGCSSSVPAPLLIIFVFVPLMFIPHLTHRSYPECPP